MRFRSRTIRRLCVPLLGLAVAAAIAPASAVAAGQFGNATATPVPIVGDTPADYPGMPGAPKYDGPTTIEVVRPERPIVRDVDQVLPISLAALALLVALGGTAYVLVRTRSSSPAGARGSY